MNTILSYAHKPSRLAHELARLAVRALYWEVKIYPKPGLVSFVDSGAHQDMNGETFLRSLFSLRHYFIRLIQMDRENLPFEQLKSWAIQSEQRMLKATRGVNTHRGAIFSLGLLCVSAARFIQSHQLFSPDEFHQQLCADWQHVLAAHRPQSESHGQQVIAEYNVQGATEMARQGYAILFDVLNHFLNLYRDTKCLNQSGLFAYAYFLSQIDDTNILYRKGTDGLLFAKQKANKLLHIKCASMRHEYGLQLHQEFSQAGLSPGGVGDLIASLIFVSQLFSEELRCHS